MSSDYGVDPVVTHLQNRPSPSPKRWLSFIRKNKATSATREGSSSNGSPRHPQTPTINNSSKPQDPILPLVANTETIIKPNKNSSKNRVSVAPNDETLDVSKRPLVLDGISPIGSLLQRHTKSSVIVRNLEGSFKTMNYDPSPLTYPQR